MRSWGIIVTALFLLSACGDSDRPVYSGREENTKGVPGFNYAGKKLHPNVKLGQSYTVSGVTYVPRYQPDYDEEGLASWYGPGFHGGRTANGESFSTHDMTAAHTTLPLPSIVRVTHVGNGRSVYVRINDRGPFAKGRIIDLSRAAAAKIGLLQDGVAKVRVQYMPAESEYYISMITQGGRSPQSIDIASEVIGKVPTQFAKAAPVTEVASQDIVIASNVPPPAPVQAKEEAGWWDVFNPISSAQAEETTTKPAVAQPTSPQMVMAQVEAPPRGQLSTAPVSEIKVQVAPQPTATRVVPIPAPGAYVQLGAFSQEANARSMQLRVANLGESIIKPKQTGDATLYRVRLGPFASDGEAKEMLARVDQMGIAGAAIVRE